MFKDKINPRLKNVKMESVDEALKRGIIVQTTFLSVAEKKREKNEIKNQVKQYVSQDDTHNAEHYQYLKSMGMIER